MGGGEGRREEDSTSVVVGIDGSGLGDNGEAVFDGTDSDGAMVGGGGRRVSEVERRTVAGEGGDGRGEEETTLAVAGIEATFVSPLGGGETAFVRLSSLSRLESTCSASSICSTFTALEGSTVSFSFSFSSPSSD